MITDDWWWLPGSEITIEWTLTNWIVERSEQKTLTATLPGAAVQDGARKYLDVNCGADRPRAGRLVFECPDIDASEPVEVRGVDQDGRRVVWTGSARTGRAGIPVVYTDEVLWQPDQELRVNITTSAGSRLPGASAHVDPRIRRTMMDVDGSWAFYVHCP